MAKNYWLDKRHLVSGKDSKSGLDNRLSLTNFISEVSEEQIQNSTYLNETLVNEVLADASTAVSNTIYALQVVNNSYEALATDYRIFVDQTDAAITITLPSGGTLGKPFYINAITYTDPVAIVVSGGGTINGAANYQIAAQYGYVEVVEVTSGNWVVVNEG